MSMFKKISHFISSVFFYSIMAVLVVIVFMFLAYFVDQKIGLKQGQKKQPLFGAYIIMSNSMVPNINVQDAVVTVRVKQDNIKVNDIITFLSKEIKTNGTPITHRVIGIVNTDTGVKYRTKGDHNNTEDFALISSDEVIGKVFFRIPLIGYVRTFLAKPIGWLLIIVIPCLLMIGSDVFKIFRASHNKKDNVNIVAESNNNLVGVENSEKIISNLINVNHIDNSVDVNNDATFNNKEDDIDIL